MHTTLPRLLTACYRHWQPRHGLLVRTSLGAPRWFPDEGRSLPRLPEATPRGWMLGQPDWRDQYAAMLERIGPDRMAEAVLRLATEHTAPTLVLGCFEGDPAECHRSLFAAWWHEQTGQPVLDVREVTR